MSENIPDTVTIDGRERTNFAKLIPQIVRRNGTVKPAPKECKTKTTFAQKLEKYAQIKGYHSREAFRNNGGVFCLQIMCYGYTITLHDMQAHDLIATPELLANIIGAGYDVAYC